MAATYRKVASMNSNSSSVEEDNSYSTNASMITDNHDNDHHHHHHHHPPAPLTPMVKTLAVFAAIGGFLFGYDTGVISGAMIQLRVRFNLNTVWQELIVSVTIGAAAVASLAGVFLNDRLGRRPVIIIASSVFTVGAVVLAVAPSKEVLLIGRAIVGLGVGEVFMFTINTPDFEKGIKGL